MSSTYEAKAVEGLEQLGMTIAREQLDTTAQKAAAHKWSYSHFLGYLLEAELKGKTPAYRGHEYTLRPLPLP